VNSVSTVCSNAGRQADLDKPNDNCHKRTGTCGGRLNAPKDRNRPVRPGIVCRPDRRGGKEGRIQKDWFHRKAPSEDILGDTYMVDVAKVVESRSGVTKYYETSTRLLNFEEPENFESDYAEIIDDVARRLEETIRNLRACISKRGGWLGI